MCSEGPRTARRRQVRTSFLLLSSVAFTAGLGAESARADPVRESDSAARAPEDRTAAPGAEAPRWPPTAERREAEYWAARNWREGDPAPPGYHLEPRAWNGMIIGGAIPLAVAYGFSIMGATIAGYSNNSGWLFVPALGPWITAFTMPRDTCDRYYGGVDCYPNNVWRGLLVFDGFVQTAGLAMVIIGAETEKHRLVHDTWSLSVRPLRVGTGYGLGVSGEL